jgi:hypothetical protein
MVVDVMRQSPQVAAARSSRSAQANLRPAAVQEELRRMIQRRALLTLDLKAIPKVSVHFKGSVAQVEIPSAMLFAENSGALKEQGVPVLDRVSAWLKTFGQQPVIIHCYPEELQDPSVNGSLFLSRYSELYNFFVEERKLAAQRFISADLLVQKDGGAAKISSASAVALEPAASTGTPRVVIETMGSQTSFLEAMPSVSPRHAVSRPLEFSIEISRKIFNPEEGEWSNIDIAALTRTGARHWTFKISPADDPSNVVMKTCSSA